MMVVSQDRIEASDEDVGTVAFQDIAEVNEASSSNLGTVEPLGMWLFR